MLFFQIKDGQVYRNEFAELHSNHEEADTKICLHAMSRNQHPGDIVIRASDTDIMVILSYHCHNSPVNLRFDPSLIANVSNQSFSETRP